MRRTKTKIENKKYVDVNELMEIVSLGKANCRALGKEAEAEVRIGERRILYDVEKILTYLKGKTEVKRGVMTHGKKG